jgi:hypothetical protein
MAAIGMMYYLQLIPSFVEQCPKRESGYPEEYYIAVNPHEHFV